MIKYLKTSLEEDQYQDQVTGTVVVVLLVVEVHQVMTYLEYPFCPVCFYFSQQLGTTIHLGTLTGDCPYKATTVKLFGNKRQ